MEGFLEKFQHLKIQLEDIKSATNNFDNSNVIGKGGFGRVYKGVLSLSKGQIMVAFKRLDRKYGQGDPEFLKEILMLSRYTHENLIPLLGFCDEDDEKILVYEYASHGSLDRYIGSTTLTWMQRLKICLGAAMGLSYLHDPKETQQRVLHRDIKSSNILLDEKWNARVSDLGLSKIGPANQNHTFLITNVVVLCGRLCSEISDGHFRCLVRMWIQSYEKNKLDEIIFQDLKQHMDLRSLEAFSDIAYLCLQKSREGRPKMSSVVEKLEIAHRFQEVSEGYEEMGKIAVSPLVYSSKEELKMLLSEGILVNGGNTRFWLNKNGEHCEMLFAEECLIPICSASFPVDCHTPFYWEFKTHVRTQFLSPHITYTVNLVFNFGSRTEDYLGFNYILDGETNSSTSYLVDEREDGWLMAELYQFDRDNRNFDLQITFKSRNPLAVRGIKFQPLEILNGNTSETPSSLVDARVDSHIVATSGSEPFSDTASSTLASPVNENWVCCDKCQKWRRLPPGVTVSSLPLKWICSMLDWLPGMNRCSISEEETTNAMTRQQRLWTYLAD